MNARSTPLLLILAACRAAPAPVVAEVDPARGARASEHLSAAGQHAARAAKYAQLADALRNQPQRRYDDPRTGLWVRAIDEERQADAHVAAAAALEAEARDRCAGFSPEDAQVSVLQRLAQGGEARPDGVIVYLPGQRRPGRPPGRRAALSPGLDAAGAGRWGSVPAGDHRRRSGRVR
jgi:hypothetical protein